MIGLARIGLGALLVAGLLLAGAGVIAAGGPPSSSLGALVPIGLGLVLVALAIAGLAEVDVLERRRVRDRVDLESFRR